MLMAAHPQMAVCLALTHAISRSRTVEEIYAAALDALDRGLAVSRSSILLFDPDGVMRFKAYRGLSDGYRRAVEGHTPWSPDSPDPQPIVVANVAEDESLEPYGPVFARENIAAMAFIPLVSLNRVIGKFMLYYAAPHALTAEELQLAGVVAAQVAFAVERTRAEENARRSEERLRFALEAAAMGTWDWDVGTQQVRWSENLERVHGLEPGSFDGTLAGYEREIHPDDRDRVLASLQTAIATGAAHEVEYRVVGPDGTVRWLETKGRVEYEDDRPVRMTGVCMAVTERKQAELERIAAAEEASRLKDEFLATLSHELRTPLNAILGWVQMLQSEQLPPDRMRHAIEVMSRNARLQAQLIEDILDVSRIIAGKLDIDRLPVHLPQLVDIAVAAVQPAASGKQIRLTTDIVPHLPPIEGDPKRLQQVLGNLLGNAIKFTPDQGQIRVTCAADGDAIVIAVQDSGVGLSPEFLPFVFDRFRQADSRSTRRHGGLGLGLAIARHLVELHGGTIRASSAGPGCGTTVRIRIPAGAQTADGLETRAAAGAPGDEQALRLDGRRVLVVDDHRDSRELLAAVFDAQGADVVQYDSAAAVVAHLASSDVHLIVADIAMPEVDGYELIRRVRQLRRAVPAVAVSAYARPEDRCRALAAGYDAYCAKPFTAAEVLRVVGQVLERR
jgi:PAS domain S-box-containing protein